jgi:hypothetical protein
MSPNITYGITLALFIVWELNKGRWGLFFKAMTGQVVLTGTNG